MRPDDRRRFLRQGLAGCGALAGIHWRPAQATPQDMAAAIQAWSGGATLREGRVHLDIAPLVDNGNLVPVSVRVQSPMTPADHVREIALFNEANPQPDIVRFQLHPALGVAQVAARIRLATSQHLVAVARLSDGSFWQHRVEVVVTLAACIE